MLLQCISPRRNTALRDSRCSRLLYPCWANSQWSPFAAHVRKSPILRTPQPLFGCRVSLLVAGVQGTRRNSHCLSALLSAIPNNAMRVSPFSQNRMRFWEPCLCVPADLLMQLLGRFQKLQRHGCQRYGNIKRIFGAVQKGEVNAK